MSIRGLLAVLTVVAAAGVWLSTSAPAQDASMPSIEALDRLLADDQQEALVERLQEWLANAPPLRLGISSRGTDPIAAWIQRNAGRIAALDRGAFWFPLVVAAWSRDADIVDRMAWLFLWRIRLHYDMARCTDRDAGNFVGHLEWMAADVSARTDFGGQQVLDALDRALAIDQANPYRGSPELMCLGRRAPEASSVGLIRPQSEWPALYERARSMVREQRAEVAARQGTVVSDSGLMIEYAPAQSGRLRLRATLHHVAPVRSLTWSGDGGSVATFAFANTGDVATATIWSAATGARTRQWITGPPGAAGVRGPAAFVRDGTTIVTADIAGGGPPGVGTIRDIASGSVLGLVEWPSDIAGTATTVTGLQATRDGRFLAAEYARNGRCGTLIFDASAFAVRADIRNESGTGAWGLRFASDSRTFALFHSQGDVFGISAGELEPFAIRPTRLQSAEIVAPLKGHMLAFDGRSRRVAFSLVSAFLDIVNDAPVVDERPACLIEADDPTLMQYIDLVRPFRIHGFESTGGEASIRQPSTATSLEWSDNGRCLAAVFHESFAYIWDLRPADRGSPPDVAERGFRAMEISPIPPTSTSQRQPQLRPIITSRSNIGLVRISSQAQGTYPRCAQFSPDSRMVAICNGNDLLILELAQD